MAFGTLLQQTRVAARVSLRELGRAVGLSPVYLSDIEGGSRRPPAPAIIMKIAERLGVDPAPLLEAALAERESIELPVAHADQSRRLEAALALARNWDQLDDATLERLTRLINGAEEEA